MMMMLSLQQTVYHKISELHIITFLSIADLHFIFFIVKAPKMQLINKVLHIFP